MWLVIEDHDNLFIMAEFVHFAGIGMLLYKLFSKKNAGGKHYTVHSPRSHRLSPIFCMECIPIVAQIMSFRSVFEVTGVDCSLLGNKAVLQASLSSAGCHSFCLHRVTVVFLKIAPTLCSCSFMMEYDIHTFLDLLTLLATLLVIYMLRFPLRDSYQAAEDNIQSYFVVCGLYAFNQYSAALLLQHKSSSASLPDRAPMTTRFHPSPLLIVLLSCHTSMPSS